MTSSRNDLENFCREEYPQLVGSLRLVCSGDQHLAEDLAQEALTRLFRDWRKVASGPSPRSWLYKVALNLARSNWRRQKVRRRIEARLNLNLVEKDHAEDVADRDLVRRAMDVLLLRERTVIVLRQYRHLSVRETAAAMGVSEQAVRSLHHRAVGKLREALADETLETPHGA